MYQFIKRGLDIVLAASLLVLLSPVFILLVLILRCTGEGQVFFGQERIGFNNKSFTLLKFVTMRTGSEKVGTITAHNDKRVLPFGQFLRKTKLNELPQLLNVLSGDMSIVGPRPQTPECYAHFPNDIRGLIYRCKPGLTGIGSLVFSREEQVMARAQSSGEEYYRNTIMPFKGALELWYYENNSLLVDAKIVLLTAVTLFRSSNGLAFRSFQDLPLNAADPNLLEQLLE